jgi:hypothetical protein
MEAISCSEMLVSIYQSTQYNIPEDFRLYTCSHGNFRSHLSFVVSVVELLLLCHDVNHGINPLKPKIIRIVVKDSVHNTENTILLHCKDFIC